MKDLEERLRSALQRTEPPAGFAERVQSRVRSQAAQAPRFRVVLDLFLHSYRVRWVGVAATACLLVALGVWRHEQQLRMRAQGEHAREQVLQALRIASVKLNHVKKMVQQADQDGASRRL
jgi:hypothetical protein